MHLAQNPVMRNLYINLTLLLIVLATTAEAQRWKRYRHEAWGGLGATNFLGELGGGATEAKDFILDFDGKATRWVVMGGYRYKLNEVVSLRGNLGYARLYGSDEFSGDHIRRSRNLKFRSPLVEMTGLAELYFIREKASKRYRVRGIRGALGSGMSAYVCAGIGGMFFNPRGEYNGKWYSLQPLRTEGQGLPGGPKKKYSRINANIPFGIGLKYTINRNMSLSFEYCFRYTFTDYMDDVSTSYYDPNAIRDAAGGQKGEAAYYFSNPAIEVDAPDGTKWTTGGQDPWATEPLPQVRGDKTTNDTYMFAIIGLNYKFTSRKANRPKF